MKRLLLFVIVVILVGMAALFLFGEYERISVGRSLGNILGDTSGNVIITCQIDRKSCAKLNGNLEISTLPPDILISLAEVEQSNHERVVYKTLEPSRIKRLANVKWCLGFDTTPDTTQVIIMQNGKIAFSFSPMPATNIFGRPVYIGIIERGYYYPCGFLDMMAFGRFMKEIGLPPE